MWSDHNADQDQIDVRIASFKATRADVMLNAAMHRSIRRRAGANAPASWRGSRHLLVGRASSGSPRGVVGSRAQPCPVAQREVIRRAFGGKSPAEIRLFDHRRAAPRPSSSGAPARRAPRLLRPETDRICTLSLLRRPDPSRTARQSAPRCRNGAAIDAMALHQRDRRIHRGLGPAADRIGLEVLPGDLPTRTEVVQNGARLALDQQGGRR